MMCVQFQGQTYFECPLCKKIWSYVEVRKLAKLTADERLYFERTLTENTMKKMDEVKTVCTLAVCFSE